MIPRSVVAVQPQRLGVRLGSAGPASSPMPRNRAAGLGVVELLAEGGERLGPAGRGERIEPDEQDARSGMDVAEYGEGPADQWVGLVAGADVVPVKGAGRVVLLAPQATAAWVTSSGANGP